MTAEEMNALAQKDAARHYLSHWFISDTSGHIPNITGSVCYHSRGGLAGARCTYNVDDIAVSGQPNGFTFSNVQVVGRLPNGIQRMTADVERTVTAHNADNEAASPVFAGDATDYRFMGGWLEDGMFGVLSGVQGEDDEQVIGWVGLNLGTYTSSLNPRPLNAEALMNNTEATWLGAVIGKADGGQAVTGAMTLTYHFNQVLGSGVHNDDEVSVAFSRMTDGRTIAPFERMFVRDATFERGGSSPGDRHIRGGFFGAANSEEVLGNFYSDGITGAFGGVRQNLPSE